MAAEDAKRAEIIRFWRAVELFSPQSVDAVSRERRVFKVKPDQPLPREPDHELARMQLRRDQTWRHTARVGVYAMKSCSRCCRGCSPRPGQLRRAPQRRERPCGVRSLRRRASADRLRGVVELRVGAGSGALPRSGNTGMAVGIRRRSHRSSAPTSRTLWRRTVVINRASAYRSSCPSRGRAADRRALGGVHEGG